MGNIDTYVRDAGQKSFFEEPFNDVDNLILSYLVYYDFRDIVPTPGQKRSINVADAAKQYKEKIGDTQKTVRPVLLEDMGSSVRFRDVKLSDRVDIFQKSDTQFSALCVTLPDKSPYFVFRGIDYTVTGWQEVFQTSYMETHAQKLAAAYLQNVLPKRIQDAPEGGFLGGHSKGGNLALYAAVHLEKEDRDRIRRIYQNDAPGLAPGSYDPEVLREFEGRITRIAPEFAVIDSVYKTGQADRIVRSDAEGFNQHEPFSWVVEGYDFAEKGTPDPEALKIQTLLRKWIGSLDPSESRSLVRRFFGLLQQQADEGELVRISKAGDVLSLIFKTWAGASRPAKKAMLRLAKAAVSTVVQKNRQRNENNESNKT